MVARMVHTAVWPSKPQSEVKRNRALSRLRGALKTPVQFRSGDRASNMHRWQASVRSEGHGVIGIRGTGAVKGGGLLGSGGRDSG